MATSTAQSLFIAGPSNLDHIGEQTDLIGGAAAYAAIAAAPFTPCQLWSRVGADYPENCTSILERRRIDLAGFESIGDTNFWDGTTFYHNGNALPELEPHSAENVGVTLCIDLSNNEQQRADALLARLDGASKRMTVLAPGRACSDWNYLESHAPQSQVLIMTTAKAQQLSKTDNPIDAASALQNLGPKAVILTAGINGGIIAYKQKHCCYLALPQIPKDNTGISSTFAGLVAAYLCKHGKLDFRGLKRCLAIASAVAGACGQGFGPRKLLELDCGDSMQQFNKLRRTSKF